MDSSSTPTTEESPRIYHPNLPLDDVASHTTDVFFDTESFDTESFISNTSFVASQPSIASYKTEKSVNSRKSRYNTLPRHKYAGIERSSLRPPLGPMLSDVEDAPDVETELRGESNEATKTIKTAKRNFESDSGPSISILETTFDRIAKTIERSPANPSGVGAPSSPTLPPIASELAIARRSAPKQKGAEQVWVFYGRQVIEQAEMSPPCSGCQSALSGNRYKCGICNNFTICRACFSDVHNIHPIHTFLEMKVKPASRTRNHSELSDDNVDEPSLKHPGVHCFNCMKDIVGTRFHCVDCTMENIDLCSDCEIAGLPGNLDVSDGEHSSSHIMLKIPLPLNMNQVLDVSQLAHGLRHGRDRADLRGVSPMRSSPGGISSHAVSNDNGTGTDIEEDYVHLQICNSCNKPIIGFRYQCLNCPSKPSSFNLCSDCEAKSYRVHDPMHAFLKIHRRVDIPGPLESDFPMIPILYRDPAGPRPGRDIPEDPAAYLRDLTHSFTLCDRHMRRIVGKWYRCAFCSMDLCTDCEVLDTHDSAHLFLVFKAPVDMQAFRHFTDLDNPRSSPPVLHGNVYYPRHE